MRTIALRLVAVTLVCASSLAAPQADAVTPHTVEQYSPRGRAMEAAGGYWTVRDVEIAPLHN
jgi:hypothetical protein